MNAPLPCENTLSTTLYSLIFRIYLHCILGPGQKTSIPFDSNKWIFNIFPLSIGTSWKAAKWSCYLEENWEWFDCLCSAFSSSGKRDHGKPWFGFFRIGAWGWAAIQKLSLSYWGNIESSYEGKGSSSTYDSMQIWKFQIQCKSFINVHIECKHALPEQMILYKHAILLHKVYDVELPAVEWTALNFQQLFNSRQ